MRWLKVAGIAAGVLIALFVVSTVIGYLIDAVVAAVVVAAIVLVVKAVRHHQQVSQKDPAREVGEATDSSTPRRQKTPNVDRELARLKREMGNSGRS
jgi:MFS superfamily sulfate permease-like transporter